jgi:peptidoglycan lytic transglycosylase G
VSNRTPEEREAARLERERRRAERAGRVAAADQPAPESESEPEPEAEPEPEPEAEPEPEPEAEPELGSEPESEPDFADEPQFTDQRDLSREPEPEGDFEDDVDEPYDHDEEIPAGTKRVPRSQRPRRTTPLRARRRRKVAAAPKPRKLPRKLREPSRVGRIVSLLAFVVAGALIWCLIELFQPFQGSPHGQVTVTIPAHSSASQVGDILADNGVISSSFFFQLRAALDGDRSDLRAGTYHLQLGMSYGDALRRLTTPPKAAKVTNLTIIEGRTRRQIDALLRSQHVHGSYLAATRHSRALDPRHYGAPRSTPDLEGFLFPSTYQLRDPISINALVGDQLSTFKREFGKVKLSNARGKHLTPYDVLIIASIIEQEAATSHDLPLVASVIYNRLKDHMPLGMDSTTRYEFNDYTKPLTSAQLAAKSPYNTRRNLGLPPTPIGNPGMSAIQAAAHPANTRYLYFVARVCGNGSSVFETNYQQFLHDSAKYQSARARRGGSPTHC